MTTTYKPIPSRRWRNSKTGAIASLYGAVPWYCEGDRKHWLVETVGWTIQVTDAFGRVTVGVAAGNRDTEEEAQQLADELNQKFGSAAA